MSRGICLKSPPLGERWVSGRNGDLAGVGGGAGPQEAGESAGKGRKQGRRGSSR